MLAFGVMAFLLSMAIIAISLLLIGLILLQKNRGAGLSGAFGGVGGHSAFGTKTGDFLTWVTVSLVAVFLLLNIAGNYVFEPEKIVRQAPPTLPDEAPADSTDATNDASDAPSSDSTTPVPVTPAPASPAESSEPTGTQSLPVGN